MRLLRLKLQVEVQELKYSGTVPETKKTRFLGSCVPRARGVRPIDTLK